MILRRKSTPDRALSSVRVPLSFANCRPTSAPPREMTRHTAAHRHQRLVGVQRDCYHLSLRPATHPHVRRYNAGDTARGIASIAFLKIRLVANGADSGIAAALIKRRRLPLLFLIV